MPLTTAPRNEETANRCLVLMMSGRLSVALSSVPATKPSCTAMASQLICEGESFHSSESAGTTAEPLNQSAIPNNSAAESSVNARQRRGCGGVVIQESCKSCLIADQTAGSPHCLAL